MHPFSDRELATVLAALRYWQRDLIDSAKQGNNLTSPEHFTDTVMPLTFDEIDDLCERLNCQHPRI